MKRLFQICIVISLLLAVLQSKAQNSPSDKLYNTFAGKEGVFTLSFTKSVLKPFEIFLDNETKQVIYKMKRVRLMAYNKNRGDLSSRQVFTRIENTLQNGKYFNIDPEELELENHDIDTDRLRLKGHRHKDHMDEFHLIIYDNNHCFLFSFFGEITIDDLNECRKFSHSARGFIDL